MMNIYVEAIPSMGNDRVPLNLGKIWHYGSLLLTGLAALFFFTLSIFTVPAPDSSNAYTVVGKLVKISLPHPQYQDISIHLDNGGFYYVNRATEVADLDLERLFEEVKPGDTLILTVVEPLFWRWFGIDHRKTPAPVAGIQTSEMVYMDSRTSAETWRSQAVFSRNPLIALGVFVVLASLEFTLRRRPSRLQKH